MAATLLKPSEVPDGHPGDFVWRLPLARTLARLNVATGGQLEQANEAVKQGGFFVSRLAEAGVKLEHLLACFASVTGLHSALPHDVRHPKPALASVLPEALCRALLAVPVSGEGGLKLAVVVPLTAEQVAQLPPHTAEVALEIDVRQGLDALWPHRRHPSLEVPVVPGPRPSAPIPMPEDPPVAEAVLARPAPPPLDLSLLDELGPLPAPPPGAGPADPSQAPPDGTENGPSR